MSDKYKFETLLKAPPKSETKNRLTPSPFSKERTKRCCLSSKNWGRLRSWIDEHYHHPDLGKFTGNMTVIQLLAFCQDKLWLAGNMLHRHHVLDIDSLPFRSQLDEAAIEEAVKNLGWKIDANGVVREGAGDGLPTKP